MLSPSSLYKCLFCNSALGNIPELGNESISTSNEPTYPQENIRRKSFLLTRIFSKPPSKDQEDEDEASDQKDGETFSDNSNPSKEEKSRNAKTKTKKNSERPSRKASKNINLREASSDSESVDSNTSKSSDKPINYNQSKNSGLLKGNTSIVCTSCHK